MASLVCDSDVLFSVVLLPRWNSPTTTFLANERHPHQMLWLNFALQRQSSLIRGRVWLTLVSSLKKELIILISLHQCCFCSVVLN